MQCAAAAGERITRRDTERKSAFGVAHFPWGDYDGFSLSPDAEIGCLLFGRL